MSLGTQEVVASRSASAYSTAGSAWISESTFFCSPSSSSRSSLITSACPAVVFTRPVASGARAASRASSAALSTTFSLVASGAAVSLNFTITRSVSVGGAEGTVVAGVSGAASAGAAAAGCAVSTRAAVTARGREARRTTAPSTLRGRGAASSWSGAAASGEGAGGVGRTLCARE